MQDIKKTKREIAQNNRRIITCNERIVEWFRVLCRERALDKNFLLKQGRELFDELDNLQATNAILKEYISEKEKTNTSGYFKIV